jgi:AraC-like DNA-binding protein
MNSEPTTLSDVIRLIKEVLKQHYGIDPVPLLEVVGIDSERAEVSGSRVPRDAVMHLWDVAVAATNDPSIGLVVGSKIRSTTYYALGLAFMTSDTLLDSLEQLARYIRVIATVPLELTLRESGQRVVLEMEYIDERYPLVPVAFDSFIASVVALCRLATTPAFSPVELRLKCEDNGRGGDYRAVFNAPVVFGAKKNALVFKTSDLREPLPGRSTDLMYASDRILEDYVAALQPDAVSTEVRKLLLSLLPSGKANQDMVAKKLNMSRSTLQRRLQEESTNYRELLESTRQSLAIEYVRSGEYSLSYIAYLLGFSDQSNFSRAFRRWTGQSPKAFRTQ